MRRLHNLFHVPKGEQVTDKYLRRVLISSLCSIVLCMSCLMGSTWAWFQTTIVNEGNVITIGEFQAAVALVKGGTASRSVIRPSVAYTYELDEVGTYNITVINTGSIPGYCEIKLTDSNDDSERFTTGTLYPSEGDTSVMDSVTITITIDAEDNNNGVLPVTLKITPHWGADPNYEVAAIDAELFTGGDDDEDPDNTDPSGETTKPDSSGSTGETTDPDGSGSIGETTDPDGSGSTGETTDPDGSGSTGETTDPDGSGSTGETTDPDGSGSSGETTDPDGSGSTGETTDPDGSGSTEETTAPDGSGPTEETTAPDGSGPTEETTAPTATESSGEPKATDTTGSTAESQPDQQTE